MRGEESRRDIDKKRQGLGSRRDREMRRVGEARSEIGREQERH